MIQTRHEAALATLLAGHASRASVVQGLVHIKARAIEVVASQVHQRLLANWPPGSGAHVPYFFRIDADSNYQPHQVV